MKYLASILFITLIFTTILGFVSMVESMDHSGGGCIASTVSGVACVSTAVDFALQHIRAYNIFSNVTIVSLYGFTLSIIGLFLLLGTGLIFYQRQKLKLQQIYFGPRSNLAYSNKRQKDFYWLSLLENSPSLN
ncbi:MAG: hypothetical protein HZA94_00995 [Candidatus Vogelbacteria bacterium]|nr:hypothetical protein [Candidatus Vogelbacteria bacterium]